VTVFFGQQKGNGCCGLDRRPTFLQKQPQVAHKLSLILMVIASFLSLRVAQWNQLLFYTPIFSIDDSVSLMDKQKENSVFMDVIKFVTSFLGTSRSLESGWKNVFKRTIENFSLPFRRVVKPQNFFQLCIQITCQNM